MTKRIIALLLIVVLLILSGCSAAVEGTKENDILTFTDNSSNKPIIHIAMQYYSPQDRLIKAIQEEFPQYLIVADYKAAAGTMSELSMKSQLDNGVDYDMVLCGNVSSVDKKGDYFVDLSAKSFMNNYLLSSLNRDSEDGHIYSLPGASTLAGIAYNVDMFEEHGWQVPTNWEEFFTLCEKISACNIRPFSCCAKYSSAINRLLTTMCYDQMYMSLEDSAWVDNIVINEADCEGQVEPLLELAQRLNDAGVLLTEDFSASLTTQRKQEFYAGKTAMLDYDSQIFLLAESEGCPFEVGVMPYPAKDSENSGFAVSAEYYIYACKQIEEDQKTYDIVMEIMEFISSEKAQLAMISDSLRISNVKGMKMPDNDTTKYVTEAYERGNLYPVVYYNGGLPMVGLQQAAVKLICEGKAVEQVVQYMDAYVDDFFKNGISEVSYAKLCTATSDFTMLETSYYIADKLRQATNADLGIVVNGGFFLSNLAIMFEGSITEDYINRFTMKGANANDCLTTYSMTGAQIKQLLEYPIVEAEEIDAFIAVSGLKIEYAPWNTRGSRVLKVTLEDGSELSDTALYTVAAWSRVIEDKYITETLKTFGDLGTYEEIITKGMKEDITITPDIKQRVKLVWKTK